MLYKDRNDSHTFPSQFEARQFFIDRIVAQAGKDNLRLTEAERHMLGLGIGAGFHLNPELAEKFNAETTEEAYERKITGLLRNAYRSDVRERTEMRRAYNEAYAVLRSGEHYMLPMIEEAMKSRRGAIGEKLRSGAFLPVLVLVVVVVMIVLFRALSG